MRNRPGYLLYLAPLKARKFEWLAQRFDTLEAARAAARPVVGTGREAVIVREDWRDGGVS